MQLKTLEKPIRKILGYEEEEVKCYALINVEFILCGSNTVSIHYIAVLTNYVKF